MKNKWKAFWVIMVVAALMIPMHALGARYEELQVTKLKVQDIEELNSTVGLTITSPTLTGLLPGDIYYVDSNVAAGVSGTGVSWATAFLTVEEAINSTTASDWDLIYVAAGHTETIDAATDLVCDKIGVGIIGFGQGRNRPTFTWATDSDATIPVSAADVVFYNCVFNGSSTATDGPDDMFNVTAAGFQLQNCEVILATATEAATLCITGSAAADRMKILDTRFYGTSAETGCSSAITFTGAAEDIEIARCTFEADFSEAAIDTNQVITQVDIHDCYINNYNDGEHAIQLDGNALGSIRNCSLVTDVYATALDPGKCDVFETYWADDGVDDVMATPVLTHEDGAVVWSATELAAIEDECEDAIELDGLDHLCMLDGGTHAYPDSPANESIVAYLMSKSATAAVTSFDNTDDSLEAIRGAIGDGYDDDAGADHSDDVQSHINYLSKYVADGDGDWATGQALPSNTSLVDIIGDFTGAHDGTDYDDNIFAHLKVLSKYIADGDGDYATGQALPSNKSLYGMIGATYTDDGGADHLDDVASHINLVMQSVCDGTGGGAHAGADLPAGKSLFDIIGETYTDDGGADHLDDVASHLNLIMAAQGPSNSTSHPNYFVVTADLSSATWNTVASHEIAAVTGAVRMQIMVEVAASTTTVSNDGTLALGWAGNTAAIFAATDIEGGAGALVTGDIVSYVYGGTITGEAGGGRFFAETAASTVCDIVLVGGVDVGYTIGTNAGATGTLKFHIWWTPLDATGAVTAGAGGTL